MCENRDLVIPVNILTYFVRAPFSWAARHTTVCLDYVTNRARGLKYTIDETHLSGKM